MEPTKILFFDHAPYEGGAEVSLKELVKCLDKKRFESVLICPKDAPYAKELIRAGIRVIDFTYHWTTYKFVLPLIFDLVKLIGFIRAEKPQVIHTNTRVTNQLGGLIKICCQAVRLSGCQALFNHIRDSDSLPWWKLKLIGRADFLIANSQQTREFLLRNSIPEDRVQVVYNGIDLSKFNPDKFNKAVCKEKLSLVTGTKIVTTIGQIYPRKGFSYLINAIKIPELDKAFAEGETQKLKLLIVGSDPTPDQRNLTLLKSLISELNLEKEVEFLGYRTDIAEILAATDVFILPSLEEPFGRVLVEAMAMELPVVATNVGGIPEIVEDGKSGFLVPPKNSSAIAEKLIILLKNDKMREEFGIIGRKIVEEKFTLQKHVEQMEKIYVIL